MIALSMHQQMNHQCNGEASISIELSPRIISTSYSFQEDRLTQNTVPCPRVHRDRHACQPYIKSHKVS